MFTSGSTGEPKGVSFSNYNLVTKRFARRPPCPRSATTKSCSAICRCSTRSAGTSKCWGRSTGAARTCSPGNPSLRRPCWRCCRRSIRPGLIGVPCAGCSCASAAWKSRTKTALSDGIGAGFRSRGGGPAALGPIRGRLSGPEGLPVFHQRNGVDLCSGFGMTEATGGITMTPPGKYVDNSHGLPLPGIQIAPERTGRAPDQRPLCRRGTSKTKGRETTIPIPDRSGPNTGSARAICFESCRTAITKWWTASRTSTRTTGARPSPPCGSRKSSSASPGSSGRSSSGTAGPTTCS